LSKRFMRSQAADSLRTPSCWRRCSSCELINEQRHRNDAKTKLVADSIGLPGSLYRTSHDLTERKYLEHDTTIEKVLKLSVN